MARKLTIVLRSTILLTAAIFLSASINYTFAQTPDTSAKTIPVATVSSVPDTLHYPLTDRRTDRYSSPQRRGIDLADPSNIGDSVVYDPKTREYYVIEKVGSFYYRKPTTLTFQEFLKLRSQIQEDEYFRQRADVLSNLNYKLPRPKMSITDNLFNRIFGTGKVEIKPQGDINVIAGYQGQNIKNPALPERARKNGGFDFDMNANLSVIGNIGDKLKLPISYNTLANFDFQNQLKLDYTGKDDEIIKRIEAGNVSFSTKGSLISGAQSLFGIKTQLQFGKLFVTGVVSNQRSQKQTIAAQGGSSSTYFEFKANDYEENRHFLMSQYFRKNYNKAMSQLPIVNSQVQILRVEVWVTNRNGSTTQTRDVVGLMDLGESQPYNASNPNLALNPAKQLPNGIPDNDVNMLYRNIVNDMASRNSSTVTAKLSSLGLTAVQDYEKTFARQLSSNEYYLNPQVGFISLTQPLQPDEVLAVAYQYSYNGKIYQVGEFSQDAPPDTSQSIAGSTGSQKVLFLKLLKATSQRTNLPLWGLMMKNVYSLKTKDGSYLSTIQPGDFKLNILYDEPSLGQKRFLPEETPKSGVPLLTLENLDRLNARNDPLPDGVFDYIEGFTVLSSQARIIFPFLEPFGHDLETAAFSGASQEMKQKYVFYPLYDTIKEIAKTYSNLDRYVISGTAKGQSNSEISLGAFNVPQGSVTVSAGGQVLKENVDYTIDYNLGTVKIINSGIISSGVPISVGFENNAGYGLQQKNFMGLRLDYLAKTTATESLTLGGTIEKLSERPYFTKMSIGEDPIRNTMYGLDFNYRTQVPRLTRWLDKLPYYNTTEMSTLTAYGEGAFLKPGHPKQIGSGSSGQVYIDDFEGTRNAIDLRFPLVSWGLASTPAGNGLFPEATATDSLKYGFNRAKLAWYNIEPVLQDSKNSSNPIDASLIKNPSVRQVKITEIYPNKTPDFGQAQLVTFDMAYYPTDIGPYNYDSRPSSVTADGKLLNPKTRWGGIMRGLDQVDFESANIQYIEFWMQDPFLTNTTSSGGELYFNLGNISEDVLHDGKRFFENGISGAVTTAQEDSSTVWGKVPANPIQVTQAFSNDPADRPLQDAGFDGLDDVAEQRKFQSYLNDLANTFGVNSAIYQRALQDPSHDNFKNYRDAAFTSHDGILQRYKDINSPQGNSPVAGAGDQFVSAFTLYPDQEEFNKDNTLNELEEYFQYKVELKPEDLNEVGKNFITDVRSFTPAGGIPEKWYLFRIPIDQYEKKVGNIPDFKSVRFIRMFLSGFEDSVVLRFAKLELVRNQWRGFNYALDTTGQYKQIPANSPTTFNQLAVNIEENSSRQPIPYVTPPSVIRQQQLSNNNVNILLNEQSLSIQMCNLAQGDVRGVFKTISLDLRQYTTLYMFTHLESGGTVDNINDNEMYSVIRIGDDLINNFYEIRIPLRKTPWGATNADAIWPSANDLALDLQRFVKLKLQRNQAVPSTQFYKTVDPDGREYSMLGNPNLGQVQVIFLGVENRARPEACAEVWFNELRLGGLNEKGGYAALGRVDIKLADLGTFYFSGSIRSAGFGSIDQRVNERAKEGVTQFDMATNLELGKLLPEKAGMTIPVYAGISQTVSMPEFDPYDLDIKLKDKLKSAPAAQRDSIRSNAVDVHTIKTVNFTNVKKNNTSGKKQKIWSIENIDVSYSYYKETEHNPLIESNDIVRHRAGLGYNYTSTPKYVEPLKKSIKSKSAWYAILKDINFNPVPSLLSFRADVNRQFGAYRPRNVGGFKFGLPETYDKYFTFDRTYALRWDITKSLNLDFSALNKAWVDEDSGRLDKEGRKRMWDNFLNGGRTISYQQNANVSYVLPTAKVPALDWTSVRVNYVASYNWLAASLIARNLGNTLSNAQQKNVTGEFDLTKLYSKSALLRALDEAVPATSADTSKTSKKKKREAGEPIQLSGGLKALGRIITSLKRVSINYSENATASIYGYTDSTRVLGMNFRSMAPGLAYVFGRQPDTSFINSLGARGLISGDPNFNFQNRQDFNQKLSIQAQLMPVRDLTIDVNVDKTFGKIYTELYKDTTANGYSGSFARLNPYTEGSFSVSYISFQTLFTKIDPNQVSQTFLKFQDYRAIVAKRLSDANPDSRGNSTNDGYFKGYGRYSQEVLLPAFLAAYTNKDPNTIPLMSNANPNVRSNPFQGILPRPNWTITYTGLSRIPGLDKVFTNFTLKHGYQSQLSVNHFESALLFQNEFYPNYPSFIDTLTGNYVPYFLVPNISISEQFAPLLDMDMQFTNQLNARFEFKKSRTLSLSLVDYQLSEARSTEFTVAGGFRRRGAFSFLKFRGKALANDASFRLDMSFRNDETSNSRLDQSQALPTAGQKVVLISPSIDYVISNRVNIKLYFEQRRVVPSISTAPPITNTRAGVDIRVSLAQP